MNPNDEKVEVESQESPTVETTDDGKRNELLLAVNIKISSHFLEFSTEDDYDTEDYFAANSSSDEEIEKEASISEGN